IEDWKKVQVKYQGMEYCKDCHDKNYASIKKSPHQNIQCENCHGPAGTPEGIVHYDSDKRPKLTIDRSRQQCLRCHYPLPYPSSGRSKIKGIDPDKHNPDIEQRSRASTRTSIIPTSNAPCAIIPTIRTWRE
ncbi:MAG: hypothetical protein H6Q97_675, partial [Nitrospirae bacterium]|nr:hypothetical protein [Nitrospirota bacterium]